MASMEIFPMPMDMTAAVQGLVNLFLNMDAKSREMFIKLLVVKMEEEEVDLILEVVDMRNTSNTGFNTLSVKEDDVKIETGQCFNDSNYNQNYNSESSYDKNTEDMKMDSNKDGLLKEEPELTKNEPEDMLKMFVCEFCSKSFGTKTNLSMHIYRIHNKGNILKCDQCSYEISDHGSMKKHKRTHTGERPYVCHICSKTFTTNSHMNRHFKGVHLGENVNKFHTGERNKIQKSYYTGEKNHLCDICSKAFSTRQTLTIHKESIHEGIKYDCDQCEYKATDRASLGRHVAAIHEGIKFVCEECGYKASSKQCLKIHEESVHLGIRHECNQCDHKATSKNNLTQHVSYVHESIQHDCKECNYSTYKKSSFHKHMTGHRKAQALQTQTDSTNNPFGMDVN